MIEMSVDKEAALARDGHTEPGGSCARRGGAGAEALTGPTAAPACVEVSFAGSVLLAERSAETEPGAAGSGGDEGAGQGGGTRGDSTRLSDTMRAAPQPGPVRQNKRRNAVGSGLRAAGPGKRRRRANSESNPVLPSNFLLGGNIFDPLNLNSLLDEEVSRALNAETPECSPLPAKSREPVEILVPRDVTDPLSLNRAGHALLPAPRRRRPRHRHHGPQPRPAPPPRVPGRPSSPPSLPGVAPRAPREGAASPVPRPLPQNQPGSSSSCDPAPFPPALAAPGPASAPPPVAQQRKRSRCNPPGACNKEGRGPGPVPQQKKFQYGNYNKYYGYRNPGCSEDPRLRVMRPEWFRGKAVLDLGCNAGHLTLFIARHWRPGRIVGLDIDGCLVHAARQNVRHYLSHLQALEARRAGRGPGPGEEETHREGGENERGRGPEEGGGEAVRLQEGAGPMQRGEGGGRAEREADTPGPPASAGESDAPFPVSLCISRGPIAAPPLPDTPSAPPGDFPANVSFVRPNDDVLFYCYVDSA
ncbi:7SK snRNA methylphosphate capping enzyme-like isoform X2 [Conger conger]|uniref:7SK snRNA methylphosphate capping enzyme-like isoform X2 n=1 Tax=Conger conger TaxID=82655 RepID=UPI002A59FB31|nr:7SK snRNA methylphosphate capping enzyme-like isoform X2 [Conger conger]